MCEKMLYIIVTFIFVGYLLSAYIFPIFDLLLAIITSKLSIIVNKINYENTLNKIEFDAQYGESNVRAIGFQTDSEDINDEYENCKNKENNKIGY